MCGIDHRETYGDLALIAFPSRTVEKLEDSSPATLCASSSTARSNAGTRPRANAKPRPQRGLGVSWRLAGRAVTLGGAVLPGDPAGEPLTDLHHPHQVVHGGSPALPIKIKHWYRCVRK